MPNDIFNFSVPVFLRGHGILAELLRKAEAHAAERKIAPTVLLTARLFPDMFPLTGQVQGACDTAKRVTARLVGVEPPRYEDNEASFEELYARIRKTTEFVELHPADAFLAAAERTTEYDMLSAGHALGLGIVAWSPLGGGMLTGKYRKGETGRREGFGGKVFQAEDSEQRTVILDTLIAVAKEAGAAPSEIAIAWVAAKGSLPIIGPRTLAHLKDNLGAAKVALSPEQLARLDKVSAV